MNLPFLKKNAQKGGQTLRDREGAEYYRKLGKKSAQSPKRTKSYYSELGRRSVEARRKKKKLQEQKRAPLNQLADFISGK